MKFRPCVWCVQMWHVAGGVLFANVTQSVWTIKKWPLSGAIAWVFLKDTILKRKFALYFPSSSVGISCWSILLVLKIQLHTCTDIPLSSWAQASTWNQILQICIQALHLLFHQTSTDGKGFSRLTITFLCPFYLQSKLLISLSTGLFKSF